MTAWSSGFDTISFLNLVFSDSVLIMMNADYHKNSIQTFILMFPVSTIDIFILTSVGSIKLLIGAGLANYYCPIWRLLCLPAPLSISPYQQMYLRALVLSFPSPQFNRKESKLGPNLLLSAKDELAIKPSLLPVFNLNIPGLLCGNDVYDQRCRYLQFFSSTNCFLVVARGDDFGIVAIGEARYLQSSRFDFSTLQVVFPRPEERTSGGSSWWHFFLIFFKQTTYL